MSISCFDCGNEVYNCSCIDKMLYSWVHDKQKTTEIVENMYQISTHYPLAQSKKYFKTLKECAKHLSECVEDTKKHLKRRISKQSVKEGCRLLKINLKEYPKLVKMMGKEKEISTDNLDLLPLTKEKKMAGQKINDHASWIGSAPKGMPMPMHTKTKSYTSAEGAGHIGTDYPDTTEAIKRDQDSAISKAKSHPMKTGYRN